MGMLDNYDWDALQKRLLDSLAQANPEATRKAEFSQGLMNAGAQMLMNSTKGFSSALGAGGMGFLEGSNAERLRQQKDPMQQINMLNALQGIQQNAQGAQWMKQYGGGMGLLGNRPQSDFAPGEATGAITPPLQSMPVAPPMRAAVKG